MTTKLTLYNILYVHDVHMYQLVCNNIGWRHTVLRLPTELISADACLPPTLPLCNKPYSELLAVYSLFFLVLSNLV